MAHKGVLYPVDQRIRLYTPTGTHWPAYWPRHFIWTSGSWSGSLPFPAVGVQAECELTGFTVGDYALTFEGLVPNTFSADLRIRLIWTLHADGINWDAAGEFWKNGVRQIHQAAVTGDVSILPRWTCPFATGHEDPGATLWPDSPTPWVFKPW